MNNAPCDKVFDLYHRLLELHISTKTSDATFHKDSAAFYEAAFDFFHSVMEGMTDAGIAPSMDSATAKKEAMDILNELKSIAEDMVNQNKDIAIDNILRGVVENIGFQCGTMKGILGGDAGNKPETDAAYTPKKDKFADEMESEDSMEEEMEDEYEDEMADEMEDEYSDSHGYSYKGEMRRKARPPMGRMDIMGK